jgi:putative exosortase-associated protein (TIGR04073 family)
MKSIKTALIALLACIFLSFSSVSIAEEPVSASYGSKIGYKTLRGFSNIGLGFIEIPKNMIKITNESNFVFGVTGGFLLGAVNTFGRFTIGTLDLLTFPLATKPVTQPVHPWQNYLTVDTEYNSLFVLDF